MSKILHALAKQQAHNFFALCWDQLPTAFHDNMEQAQFNFELDLATFDVVAVGENLRGFALYTAVRKRAERYYQQELKQAHHTPTDWAFFRFWAELAFLFTVRASRQDQLLCHAWWRFTGDAACYSGPYCGEKLDRGSCLTGFYHYVTHAPSLN